MSHFQVIDEFLDEVSDVVDDMTLAPKFKVGEVGPNSRIIQAKQIHGDIVFGM